MLNVRHLCHLAHLLTFASFLSRDLSDTNPMGPYIVVYIPALFNKFTELDDFTIHCDKFTSQLVACCSGGWRQNYLPSISYVILSLLKEAFVYGGDHRRIWSPFSCAKAFTTEATVKHRCSGAFCPLLIHYRCPVEHCTYLFSHVWFYFWISFL